MSVKYVAAYLLSALAGKSSPSADDLSKVIAAAGGSSDTDAAAKLIECFKGKDLHEIIAAGMSKLACIPAGGSAAPAAGQPAATTAAPAAEAAPEPEEEEEDDMGFSLFD